MTCLTLCAGISSVLLQVHCLMFRTSVLEAWPRCCRTKYRMRRSNVASLGLVCHSCHSSRAQNGYALVTLMQGPYGNKIHKYGSRTGLGLLVWVLNRIAFANPDFGSFLGHGVFHEDLAGMVGFELADEPRIPKLTGDAQIFAATHHGIGFAAF